MARCNSAVRSANLTPGGGGRGGCIGTSPRRGEARGASSMVRGGGLTSRPSSRCDDGGEPVMVLIGLIDGLSIVHKLAACQRLRTALALCCAVLCCVVLCCAVLCSVVL